MIALSLALAYVASLAFVGYLLWRKDHHAESIRAHVDHLFKRLGEIETEVARKRAGWDDAARFVEAQNVAKGLRRGA